MDRIRLFLFFAIFIPALSSWGQNGVIVDGKEWLQPGNFISYSYDQVSAVCPDGACSGKLPGSAFDLTGYTWGSILDVSRLFNAYGVNPPFTEPFQGRGDDESAAAFSRDFEVTAEWCFGDCPVTFVLVSGMVSDRAPLGAPSYTAFANVGEAGGFSNTSYLGESPDEGIGAWFYRQVEDPPPMPEEDFIVNLEEPINWETHSGIGNLRGWAISEDGIDRVEIYIDGDYVYDAPFGGERTDVADQYPDFPESDRSGFSLAFGYSNLEIGEHTVTARAVTPLGQSKESTSTFQVEAFHKGFIHKWDIVDLSRAFFNATHNGSEFELGDVVIDGKVYGLLLRWRAAEQGFEIIRIEEVGSL
jgi:hypothetical protein